MDTSMQDRMLFFGRHPEIFPVYERFYSELMTRFPETQEKVQNRRFPFPIAICSPACPFCV